LPLPIFRAVVDAPPIERVAAFVLKSVAVLAVVVKLPPLTARLLARVSRPLPVTVQLPELT